MKHFAAMVATMALSAASPAQADPTKAISSADVRMVAPALDKYTQNTLLGEIWKRPGLTPRDRSIVTLAALIARNQTIEMPYYFNLALDNGVKPREDLRDHHASRLLFRHGANAIAAVAVAKDVFAERRIGADQLAAVSPHATSR